MDFTSKEVEILFCISVLLILGWSIYNNRERKVINFPFISTLVIFILAILSYRFGLISKSGWQYLPISTSSILYVDLVWGAITIKVISEFVLVNRCPNISWADGENVIQRDSAITNSKQDKFMFQTKVEEVLGNIFKNNDLYSDSAYSIGIVGGWGTGKSSFVNLLKNCVLLSVIGNFEPSKNGKVKATF